MAEISWSGVQPFEFSMTFPCTKILNLFSKHDLSTDCMPRYFTKHQGYRSKRDIIPVSSCHLSYGNGVFSVGIS